MIALIACARPAHAQRGRPGPTLALGGDVLYEAPLAYQLRQRARDAASVRLAADGQEPPVADGLTITAVEPIGHYALRLSFSDGHDRGIFPWSYLQELAREIPLQRVGDPDLVASTVIHLLENEFITGEIVRIHGGAHLR